MPAHPQKAFHFLRCGAESVPKKKHFSPLVAALLKASLLFSLLATG